MANQGESLNLDEDEVPSQRISTGENSKNKNFKEKNFELIKKRLLKKYRKNVKLDEGEIFDDTDTSSDSDLDITVRFTSKNTENVKESTAGLNENQEVSHITSEVALVENDLKETSTNQFGGSTAQNCSPQMSDNSKAKEPPQTQTVESRQKAVTLDISSSSDEFAELRKYLELGVETQEKESETLISELSKPVTLNTETNLVGESLNPEHIKKRTVASKNLLIQWLDSQQDTSTTQNLDTQTLLNLTPDPGASQPFVHLKKIGKCKRTVGKRRFSKPYQASIGEVALKICDLNKIQTANTNLHYIFGIYFGVVQLFGAVTLVKRIDKYKTGVYKLDDGTGHIKVYFAHEPKHIVEIKEALQPMEERIKIIEKTDKVLAHHMTVLQNASKKKLEKETNYFETRTKMLIRGFIFWTKNSDKMQIRAKNMIPHDEADEIKFKNYMLDLYENIYSKSNSKS